MENAVSTDTGHPENLMEKLVSLAKRRGFIFQSSEVYGGVGAVYDYGPLGVELKNNVREAWWAEMVHRRDDVEGLDCDRRFPSQLNETSKASTRASSCIPTCGSRAVTWRASRTR